MSISSTGTTRPHRGRSDSEEQLRALALIPEGARPTPHRLWPYGGPDRGIEAGRLCACFARGTYRVSEVLAVVNDEVLVEIEYPRSSRTELRILRRDGEPYPGLRGGFLPTSYQAVPDAFLLEMLTREVEWSGRRSARQPAPSAREVLELRGYIPAALPRRCPSCEGPLHRWRLVDSRKQEYSCQGCGDEFELHADEVNDMPTSEAVAQEIEALVFGGH